MKLIELKNRIDAILENSPNYENWDVLLPVEVVGSMGGTPTIEITGINSGFDWDHGKILLNLKEEVITIKKHVEIIEKYGWLLPAKNAWWHIFGDDQIEPVEIVSLDFKKQYAQVNWKGKPRKLSFYQLYKTKDDFNVYLQKRYKNLNANRIEMP